MIRIMEIRVRTLLGVLVCWSLVGAGPVHAQDLADLDYESLSFRGFGFDVGYLWPTRVDRTVSLGARFDMGYAGPGLRIVPNITYWSSPLDQKEITQLQDRISSLVAQQTGGPPPALNLGEIDWRDLAIGVDAHIVWDSLFDILTYGGLGVAAHVHDPPREAEERRGEPWAWPRMSSTEGAPRSTGRSSTTYWTR